MLILNVSRGADTGGVGILIKQAFDRHSGSDYRTVCSKTNYIGYPTDLPARALDAWWRKSDVIHLNQIFRPAAGRPTKPMVIHHHGTIFRRNAANLIGEQRQRKAEGIAATLDLWLTAPDDLEWVGAPYNRSWLQSFRRPVDDGVLRIAHAPTQRPIKSTDKFLAAAERLAREVPVQIILIERKPWVQCLELKGAADIYFDQVLLGYGNNTIEAWGMGIPVIAGGEDETLVEMDRRFGSLPFVEATESTIYEALRELVDPSVREKWARRGSEHFDSFHADQVVVPRLEAIYRKAADR